MALEPRELFGSEVTQLPNLRAYPYPGGIKPGQLASISGAPSIPHLTPLSYDEGNSVWAVWADDVTQEEFTITANATPATAGTFTLSIDGETASIAFDATAAQVQTALEGLSNIAPGDVTAVQTAGTDLGDASAVVTLTFGGAYSGVAVAMTFSGAGLTGNVHVLANTANGAGSATDQIDGFAWLPDVAHASSATGETLIQVLRRGQVHADDVPLPTTSSQTQGGLDAALLSQELRKLGLDIVGVSGVH